MDVALLTPVLFGLSFLSGMLGLGVAFVAIPVLGLFGYDLKDVIQPWALLLNGQTAAGGRRSPARPPRATMPLTHAVTRPVRA